MSNDANGKGFAKSWQQVRLYRKGENDRFTPVYDNAEKARVLSAYRDTRRLDALYSFVPMRIVFDTGPFSSDRIIHALSLLWYRFNAEKSEYQRILDPESLLILSTALASGEAIPEGCSTTNFGIDWTGIEAKAAPFNAPRFKLSQ